MRGKLEVIDIIGGMKGGKVCRQLFIRKTAGLVFRRMLLPAFLNVLPEPLHDLLDVDLLNILHRAVPRRVATGARVYSVNAQHQSYYLEVISIATHFRAKLMVDTRSQ